MSMISGYETPISKMNDDDYAKACSFSLSLCSELYLGMKKSELNNLIIEQALIFIKDYYSSIGVIEIKTAFELATANKFEGIDMKIYYGKFSLPMLGDLLSAYLLFRNNQLNKLLEANRKLIEERDKMTELEMRNFKTEQLVIKEFKAEQQLKNRFNDWNDIPHFWCKILLKNNVINPDVNTKKEFWSEAQKLVLEDLGKTAGNLDNFYEAKSARNLLNNLEFIKSQTFKEKAEVIYSKLLVWKYLK